jgi:Spy/CpxP family protein refolding chaperone
MNARNVRLLAVLSLLVTFVAGMAVGGAVTRAHDHHWFMRGGMHDPGRPHDPFAPDGELGERLKLTPPQRDSIQRIVQRERAGAEAFMREMRPRLRAHFDSLTTAIDAVLTPAQRAEFAKFRAEHRLDRHHRGGPGGPGDPHEPGDGPGMPPPPPAQR